MAGVVAGVEPRTETTERLAIDVWNENHRRLVGWSTVILGDEAAATDVASEAFVRLLSRWRTVADPTPFLFATAMNLMRDHWRKQARDGRLVERLAGTTCDQAPIRERWLTDLAGRLPSRLRGPVVLHYGADLTVEQVAIALGRPAGSVKRQLVAGRALLLAMIEEAER